MGHVCVCACVCVHVLYACIKGVFVCVLRKGSSKIRLDGLQLRKTHSAFHADVRCLSNMCST